MKPQLQKALSIVVALLLVNLSTFGAVQAASTKGKETASAERTRENILKLGVGIDARVRGKLRDNTKFEGYISEAGDESFVIVDKKTNIPMTIAYSDIKQIKGNNLSTGAKIAIGVGIGIGVIAVLLLVFKEEIESH
jgi:hypothetical protein